jgi:DNA-binding transcriptional LysR family regulator
MELRPVRYFLAVAEELHFTRAAEKMHVAQPALSRQIRQLEEEIGAKLLERTNRRVELTPAGEVFRTRALIAVEQMNRAAADAGQAGRGEAGSLSIGFVSSAVWGVLPHLLRQIRRKTPNADIELRELEPAEQLRDIRERHLDFGMMHAVLDQADLTTVVIGRDPLIVALPEKHEAAKKTSVALKSLANETFLIPKRHASAGFHELVMAACKEAGFTPVRTQATRLLQTAVALVAGGIGIALVPASFRDNLKVRCVVYRPILGKTPLAELIAVWREDNKSPLLARFRRELETLLGRSAV